MGTIRSWAVMWALGFGLAFNAAAFPTKPVTLVVPYGAGGGSDGVSRALAKRLSEIWKQPVVVENVPGADGLIGARRVMKAQPDGHTLLISIQAILFFKHLREDGEDPLASLKPVSLIGEGPTALVASAQSGIKDMAQLRAVCTAPGSNCGWASGEPFTLLAGINLLSRLGLKSLPNVRYAGTAPALNDVAGGHVTLAVSGLAPVIPHVQGGRVNVLGIASKARLPELPQVPTYAELGLGDVEFLTTWYGIFTPKGTPDDVDQALADGIRRALHDPDVSKAMTMLKINPVGTEPSEFARRVSADSQTLGRLLSSVSLK